MQQKWYSLWYAKNDNYLGIRLGSQAATTRGFGLDEFKKVGELITKLIEGLSKKSEDNSIIESEVKKEVITLCSKFPIYNHLTEN